jgi:hypothetical protein
MIKLWNLPLNLPQYTITTSSYTSSYTTMKNLSGKPLRCVIGNPIQVTMGRQGMEVEA